MPEPIARKNQRLSSPITRKPRDPDHPPRRPSPSRRVAERLTDPRSGPCSADPLSDAWKAECQKLLAKYQRLDRLYLTLMDQSGAWREIAIEQAEEIQGHPFPPKGDPRRKKALEPLGSKYEKIRDRKIANRAAGKPEDY